MYCMNTNELLARVSGSAPTMINTLIQHGGSILQ